jgi:gamma-glutamyltranspeptidase/glutathione hydrolase
MLAPFHMEKRQYTDVTTWHLFTQSSRLAFADREKYIADPTFVNVPTDGLLDNDYLFQRSQLIDIKKDMGKAIAGLPLGAPDQANNEAYERPSTTHVSIVDKEGNAVSMTSSIEMAFGSAVMVDGFILNNQLTDFSFRTQVNGKLVANRVEPLKRPRSSMAPMIVFNDDNTIKLVVGSPGGSRIINYVAKTIIGVLDWKLSPQQAINLPNITNRNNGSTLEKGTTAVNYFDTLHNVGHKVTIRDLNSGIHAIEVNENGLIGGADLRREGRVLAK